MKHKSPGERATLTKQPKALKQKQAAGKAPASASRTAQKQPETGDDGAPASILSQCSSPPTAGTERALNCGYRVISYLLSQLSHKNHTHTLSIANDPGRCVCRRKRHDVTTQGQGRASELRCTLWHSKHKRQVVGACAVKYTPPHAISLSFIINRRVSGLSVGVDRNETARADFRNQ